MIISTEAFHANPVISSAQEKKNLVGIQVHTIWLVQFLTSFDEHVVNLLGFSGLGFWIGLTHDAIHFGQDRKLSAVAADMAEIRRAVGEQDRLVGRAEPYRRVPHVSYHVPCGSHNGVASQFRNR
jgi:hypothetical protein